MNFNKTVYWLILCFSLQWFSCINIPNQYVGIAPGKWRGVLFIDPNKDIIVSKGKNKEVKRIADFEKKMKIVPFTFEWAEDASGHNTMTVINGTERIVFNDITLGKDQKTGNDTFLINLHPYAACLKGIYQGGLMYGHWIVLDKNDYAMEFKAEFGSAHRFNKIKDPNPLNLAPYYKAVFDFDSDNAYDAIGEFIQNGHLITGTFRTETGDYRYLEGELSGTDFQLSCFDGAHAFLFEATVSGDSLSGMFYSGIHYKTHWRAVADPSAVLKSADSLSQVKQSDPFYFGFETPDGLIIDFRDSEYDGKIKIVQILGSWCPNCLDESVFLADYLRTHADLPISVVGLSFERFKEKDKAMDRISQFHNKLKLNYPIAYGGIANRDTAASRFPQISGIHAYPTTLFVNRNNEIVKVHTGFDGPATSKFEQFKMTFNNTVQSLLENK